MLFAAFHFVVHHGTSTSLYAYVTASFIFSKATGSQLGTLIEISVGILMALIIAFAYSWVLSLLVLGAVPLVMITAFLQVKALSGHAKQKRKVSEKSGEV